MSNVHNKLLVLLVGLLSVFHSALSHARTLENDLTYSNMEDYCQSIAKLGQFTMQNLKKGMEKDETIDKSLDFAADEVNWSGPLAANILKVTINQAVAFNNVSDLSVSGYRRWAYNNCNRMILFNKDHR